MREKIFKEIMLELLGSQICLSQYIFEFEAMRLTVSRENIGNR